MNKSLKFAVYVYNLYKLIIFNTKIALHWRIRIIVACITCIWSFQKKGLLCLLDMSQGTSGSWWCNASSDAEGHLGWSGLSPILLLTLEINEKTAIFESDWLVKKKKKEMNKQDIVVLLLLIEWILLWQKSVISSVASPMGSGRPWKLLSPVHPPSEVCDFRTEKKTYSL